MQAQRHRAGWLVLIAAIAGCGGPDASSGPNADEPEVATHEDGLITSCPSPYKLTCPPPPPGSGVKFTCFCLPPPLPAALSGTVVPDFYVTHVIYAPPGKSSNISYASSTTLGSTTSATSGFKTDLKVTADASGGVIAGGGVSLSAGHSFGSTNSDSLDVTVQTSQGYKKSGQVDGIDHSYDEIWMLIRPLLNVTFQPAGQVASQPASVKWSFSPNQDGFNNGIVYSVYAGWLTNAMAMPADVKAVLDYYGISPSKYPALLAADPLVSGMAPNQAMNSDRFDYIGEFPYVPPFSQGNTASTQTFSVDQKLTNSSTVASDESYSVGLTVSASLGVGGLFSAKLNVANTWTWTSSSSLKESTGNGSTDSFTVGQPAFGYTGPTTLHVYEDKIYKTYAFTLDYVPTCSGACGGQSPAGCWCDANCDRYGDCCSDSPRLCGSCANACNGQSAAGCWCDSLCNGYGDCCSDSFTLCGQ